MCDFSVFIDTALVVITGLLAIFTAGLFGVAFWSLRKQGDYYKAISRPFVDVDNVDKTDLQFLDGHPKPISLNVIYQINNYGNSPAKDVQFDEKSSTEINEKYKKDFKEGKRIYSIYPNKPIVITSKEFPLYLDEKNESYIHIAITYKDMAEKLHNTLSIFHLTFEGGRKFVCVKSIFD
ncbi:hypothetical protein ACFL1R_09245 [Candidatus Latescibacterota bacterium]